MTDEICTTTTGPHFDDPSDASSSSSSLSSACTETTSGTSCPTTNTQAADCKPWQLTQSQDSCFIDGVIGESLAIAGADFNVRKLLGVHEQARLVDVTGKGKAISGGAQANFPPDNAFTVYVNEWRSLQTGQTNLALSGYIGYDFGDIKTSDGSRRAYSVDTAIRKHIMAFAIKQSSNPNQRVIQARLERSDDCAKWYGVQVVTLPDDDCLNTILSKRSVASRYWRLRPILFTGAVTDRWAVTAFQMFHNYQPTHDENIQDMVFLENRNRDYDSENITIKATYDLVDVQSELTQYGIELPSQTIYATVNFQNTVAALGRPLVVGDVIQIPSETQYTAELEPVEKWMEVTDTSWSTEGYTPGWVPTMMRVVLQPAYASEETQDIFGDLHESEILESDGLMDKGDGHHPFYQDYSTVTSATIAEGLDEVPQRGARVSDTIKSFSDEQLAYADSFGVGDGLRRVSANNRGYQVEDGLPPNNAPYTEADDYPDSPSEGDYHRLTYTAISDDLPARLYRWSTTLGKWVFMEKDRRSTITSALPVVQEFLSSDKKVGFRDILREDDC